MALKERRKVNKKLQVFKADFFSPGFSGQGIDAENKELVHVPQFGAPNLGHRHSELWASTYRHKLICKLDVDYVFDLVRELGLNSSISKCIRTMASPDNILGFIFFFTFMKFDKNHSLIFLADIKGMWWRKKMKNEDPFRRRLRY